MPVRTKIIGFFTAENIADFLPAQAEGRNCIKAGTICIADDPHMFILPWKGSGYFGALIQEDSFFPLIPHKIGFLHKNKAAGRAFRIL